MGVHDTGAVISPYGKCVLQDDLAPVLEKIAAVDTLVIGSPIYFGTVTGETRSFVERLLFPYLTYTVPYGTLFPKKKQSWLHLLVRNVNESKDSVPYFFVSDGELCSRFDSEIPLQLLLVGVEQACRETQHFRHPKHRNVAWQKTVQRDRRTNLLLKQIVFPECFIYGDPWEQTGVLENLTGQPFHPFKSTF